MAVGLDARVTKALALVDDVEKLDHAYKVPGNEKPFYLVSLEPGHVHCECAAFAKAESSCKHILAAGMAKQRAEQPDPFVGLRTEEHPLGGESS